MATQGGGGGGGSNVYISNGHVRAKALQVVRLEVIRTSLDT